METKSTAPNTSWTPIITRYQIRAHRKDATWVAGVHVKDLADAESMLARLCAESPGTDFLIEPQGTPA